MDEREKFERWFRFAFGDAPKGNVEEARERVRQLKEQLSDAQDALAVHELWVEMHRAALYAWKEAKEPSMGTR